jgi:flavin reductase (DIM6/NTAB) family NADH-FMN oxidoreductase RutF
MTPPDQPVSRPSASAAPTAIPDLAEAFRAAMRGVASTVFLVTTRDEAGPHGMAASAVISVSMEPPAMLVAVNRSASIGPVLGRTRQFCVNILAEEHDDVVAPFSDSSRRRERFSGEAWAMSEEGLPYLRSAQSALFCTVDAELEYGTHTLFVGRVVRVAAGLGGSPLVWFKGGPAEIRPSPRNQ